MSPKDSYGTLITELEGTLIPESGSPEPGEHPRTLAEQLQARDITLVYVTPGTLASAEQTIREYDLPAPDSIIAESGRAIYRSGLSEYDRIDEFQRHVESADESSGEGPGIASTIHWWAQFLDIDRNSIVVAGSGLTGTDLLTTECRTIVAGQAERELAKQVYLDHLAQAEGDTPRISRRLFLAPSPSTAGLMEGCRWFGFVDNPRTSSGQLGATPLGYDRSFFRIWAPRRHGVSVELNRDGERSYHELTREADGYFCGTVDNAGPGSRYQLRLNEQFSRPDPCSRFQPRGVHGDSQVIDARSFPWTDGDWKGIPKKELVIYELHVGAFTSDGTFLAAIDRIAELAQLGVTAVELMPVAQSPGRWNWGYDGVGLFAIRNTYGTPNDFKSFVDACHAAGIAVILDVVYNHLGPEGNYLGDFGTYFSRKHRTPWGEAFNFDERRSQQVRRFIVDNAIHWFDEYHLDGLRLDAVHFMFDDRDETIMDEIHAAIDKFEHDQGRPVHLIAEANLFDTKLLAASDDDDSAYDAIWCDCLMHSIYSHGVPDIRLTDRQYDGAGDIAKSLEQGFVYARSYMSDSGPVRQQVDEASSERQHLGSLVIALQTHDSVGNHPLGARIHQLTSIEFQKAAAALVLFYPAIPLIFMGEEYASESHFPFFVDFEDIRLNRIVDSGRAAEYPQHQWREAISPSNRKAFFSAKCHRKEDQHPGVFRWYRDLIAVRKHGVAQGWLTPERLTISHDVEQHLYSLDYRDDEHHWHLMVSLNPSDQQLPARDVVADGSILLDTAARLTNTVVEEAADLNDWIAAAPHRDTVSLNGNHAILVVRPG